MLFIREEDVLRAASLREIIEALERAQIDQSIGRAKNLPRRRIYGEAYTLHLMASSLENEDVAGLKTYLSTKQRTVFVVLLFSLSRSELLAVIEADILGRLRTGAASAVASKYLARKDSSIIGIVGSGRQAFTQALALSEIFSPEKVLVYSREKANAEKMSSILMGKGIKSNTCENLRELFMKSDVISTATNSRDPFITLDLIRRGLHINLVGSNHPNRAEAYPEIFGSANLVVTDDLEQAKIESGDLIKAVEKGFIKWESIYELWQVVSGRVSRASPDQVTIFKSHGIALWDLALAKLIYEKARREGFGVEIDFKGFWSDRYF